MVSWLKMLMFSVQSCLIVPGVLPDRKFFIEVLGQAVTLLLFCWEKTKESNLHPMKIYAWFFGLLTIAQIVFTLTWFLLVQRMDRVIILSYVVYTGVMIIGYITYEVEKYRRRKKDLMDDLSGKP